MKKQKTSSLAITFYVFSVLMLLALLFNAYTTYNSVKETMEYNNFSYADMWQPVLSSYLSYCLLPFVGAIVTYGIGCILNKMQMVQDALEACVDDAIDHKGSKSKKEKKSKGAKAAESFEALEKSEDAKEDLEKEQAVETMEK